MKTPIVVINVSHLNFLAEGNAPGRDIFLKTLFYLLYIVFICSAIIDNALAT